MPGSQYCSRLSLQYSHSRQESTMQPTPTMSPTLYLLTWPPTLTTLPTISCPGTTGHIEGPHSLRAVCRSEWQTPQNKISISTSCGVGFLRLIFIWFKGAVAASVPNALISFTSILLNV